MFMYCFFMFGFSTSQLYYIQAFSPRSNEVINKDVYNKNDLIKIITSLNHFNDNLKVNNKKESKEMFTNDELSDSEKEKNLQELLWLMRNNYDAQKQYNLIQNPVHSGARVYFIRNPDAIEEYKKYLEQKKMRPSRKRDIKNKLQDVRRKFMSRKAEESNDRSGRKSDFDNTDLNADYGTIKDEGHHQSYNGNEDNEEYINDINDKETYEEPLTDGKIPVDPLEKHEKDYQNVRAKNDFRREKSDWENNNDSEIEKKWNPKNLNKYHNIDNIKPDKISGANKHKNNVGFVKTNKRFDETDGKLENRRDKTKRSKKTYGMDTQKFTTKEYYERKIVDDNFKPKKKASYRYPKNEFKFKHRNDFSSHARTSIPFVGKKGIYEED